MTFKFLEPVEEEKKPEERLPAPIVTFDIAGAKEKILLYQGEVDKMYEAAEALEVNSEATNKDATEIGTTAEALYKKIKGITVPLYEEAKEYVERVDGFKKMLLEKVKDPQNKKRTIVSIMKAKLSQYTAKLESERRVQEALAKKAQEGLQNKLDDEAKKTGTVAPKVPDYVIPKRETTVRTESGSAHAVHKWVHEIIDLAKVPVELIRRAVDPVQSKQGAAALKSVIQDEVQKGVRTIDGVRIFEDISTTFRT